VDPESYVSGAILFPLVLQVDPRPTDITVVKVNYRVKDWGILSFDVEVSSDGLIRLPTGAIKGPGYTNPPRQPRPEEVAQGVKRYFGWGGVPENRSSTDQTTWAYVVAVDRQSGEILTEHEGTEWPANAYERRRRFLVDYATGVLDFNYVEEYRRALDGYETGAVYQPMPGVDTPDRSGRTFRIFCRAQSDWAVQLMVTPRVFGRASGGSAAVPGNPPVGFEGVGAPVLLTYAWRPLVNPYQVYFPLSEAGQTVAIDYYYMDSGSGELTFVEGEVHTISKKPDVTDLGVWVCRLEEELEVVNNPEHQLYEWGPVGVRGISVRSRAVWIGPGRTSTVQELSYALEDPESRRAAATLGERWHQVIVDNYLTRAPI
jgi:hypothetical protein